MLKWLKKIPKPNPEKEEKVLNGQKLEEVKNKSNEIIENGDEKINENNKEMEEDKKGNEKSKMMEEIQMEVDGEIDEEDYAEQPQPSSNERRVFRHQLELIPPNENIIKQLVSLNSMCLPLNYGDRRSLHYQRALKNQLADAEFVNDPQEHFFWTKMAYYWNSLVGAITLNHQLIEEDGRSSSSSNSLFQVNILTLSVLPTFRRRGVATILMDEAIQQCKKWGNVQQICLHCQSTNESALKFYRRFNFVKVEFIRNYYSNWRLHDDPNAYKLKLVLSKKQREKANSKK